MILHGALAAVSPALEEAAQTLRASRGRVFRTVTWPLLRPALANAFLLGFVESLADFANPIVLAGNFEVLSTKIFFAVAGAQHDPGPRRGAGDRCCWASRSSRSGCSSAGSAGCRT